jgi:hypothetical protein
MSTGRLRSGGLDGNAYVPPEAMIITATPSAIGQPIGNAKTPQLALTGRQLQVFRLCWGSPTR